MKVIQINEHDSLAGGSRMARSLHEALRQDGVDSWMFVQNRMFDDKYTISPKGHFRIGVAMVRGMIDQRRVNRYKNRKTDRFWACLLPDFAAPKANALAPDIFNLHWIANGFFHIDSVAKLTAPLVWTMHDMWALTGGCQWNEGCLAYEKQCGQCPVLGSDKENDLSRRTFLRKLHSWKNINVHVVSPSRWLAEAARKSAITSRYPVSVIPNGLNLDQFKPWPKAMAREILELSPDRLWIVFGAIDPIRHQNKGFHLLQAALQRLRENVTLRERVSLLVFGASEPHNAPDLGFPAKYLGHLHDNPTIALAFAAADVAIVPSRFENLPTTAIEAIACGTPVAGFDTFGVNEVVIPNETGYLAKAFEPADLAEGIRRILMSRLAEMDPSIPKEENFPSHAALRSNARNRAETVYDRRKMAQAYTGLYQRILQSRQTGHVGH